jgi:hypothetical protein
LRWLGLLIETNEVALMFRKWLVVCALIGALMAPSATCFANSVETLPEGIFVLGFKFGYKFATKRFSDSWGSDTVSITNDYNIYVTGADLDPNRFSKDDIVGKLNVDYDNFGMEFTFTAAYGITDNLSIMMIIPTQYVHSKYRLNVTDSTLYMVRDSSGNPYLIATKSDIDNVWSGVPGYTASQTPLNSDDFIDALTCQADTPMCQFRYRPIRDWSRWGIGEIITGLRYKFMENKHWRQGITVFNKWPTGRQEETDDLFDTNMGDQQYDIGFWYGVDYMPIQNLMFNLSFGYTEQLPEVKEKRIFSRNFAQQGDASGKAPGTEVGTLPLTQHWQKMKVHRDIGGNWDVYAGMSWSFLPYLSYNNEFYFFWKYLDNYWAAEPVPLDPAGMEWIPDFRSMEWGTNQSALEMSNSIGFTTLPWVMSGEFPVPLMFSIGATVGLAGQNFEQNISFWASLDLIGSIYMFEDAQAAKQKEDTDFKLPGRGDSSDLNGDPDLAEAETDADEATRTRDDYRAAERFQQNWGKTLKLGW